MDAKTRSQEGPDTLSGGCQSQSKKKQGSGKLSSCIINTAKLQSDCKNRGVLKDFHFVTLVAFAYHLITLRPQNRSLKGSKTIPKRSSMSYASSKRFWNEFGLPNSFPKEVLEASSRHQKTSFPQLGLPGRLQKGFWTPLAPLGAGF